MDSALQGVLVGAVLSLLGNVLQHWLSTSKEKREREEKRIAEAEAWQRTIRKEEGSALRDAYQNATHALTLIQTIEFGNEIDLTAGSASIELIGDAQKWISQLYLRHPSPQFDERIQQFCSRPKFWAPDLREYIVRLAKEESALNTLGPLTFDESALHRQSSDIREVHFHIDDEYRRKRFIEGTELRTQASMKCSPQDLTESQRRILIESLPRSARLLPSSFWLPIPAINRKGQLDLNGGQWRAKLDPIPGSDKSILQAWEVDYQDTLSKLKMPAVEAACDASENQSGN